MKFIFADSLDYVDPAYLFEEDRSPPEREPYWSDQFPHEILGTPPYDGILVSRAIVGGHQLPGKYSESQAMRFRRIGARKFLRYPEEKYPESVIFGDSGAFAYHAMETPPYTPEDMVDFYGDGRFTHGCSVDHIIFDFFEDDEIPETKTEQVEGNRYRFELTLAYADDFLAKSKRLGNRFTPLGVIQGWSPSSMAEAGRRLVAMGYSYLAVGGMVPLRSPQIIKALRVLRSEIGNDTPIHILGFAKAEEIGQFAEFNITSFDTTSPLIRAFKDARNNYYVPKPDGGLEYYSAIRIPQAIENNTLKNLAKEGVYSQEDLQAREQAALAALRAYDRGEADAEDALQAIMAFSAPLTIQRDHGHDERDRKKLSTLRERYERTLTAKPWQSCSCAICQHAGVEVIIFRASNRNKRRGIHNLWAYRQHINQVMGRDTDGRLIDVQGYQGAAE